MKDWLQENPTVSPTALEAACVKLFANWNQFDEDETVFVGSRKRKIREAMRDAVAAYLKAEKKL